MSTLITSGACMGAGRSQLLANALALALVCLGAAGCTSESRPAAAGPSSQPPGAAPARSSPARAQDPVRNLVPTSAVRRQLLTAYLGMMHFKPADISGTAPFGYAYDPATSRYWAMAIFAAAPHAPMIVRVHLQDGGNWAMYTRTATGSWQVTGGGIPWECQAVRYFPKAVLDLWHVNISVTAPCPWGSPNNSQSPAA